MMRKLPEQFRVAFSFAGEQRDIVGPVAKKLEEKLGEGSVFFDDWYEHYIAGHDGDTALQEIYCERSLLVIVCVSERYGNKPWTKLEHEAIRALLMQVRQAQDKSQRLRVLPIRVGDGEVKGIPCNAICPDIREKTKDEAVDLIVKRLEIIESESFKMVENEPAPFTVYLAECTPDMEEKREQMSIFLKERGWKILPDRMYPDEIDKYKEKLNQDLKKSQVFVQLIGPYLWPHGNFDRVQNESAAALQLPRFRFRCCDINRATVKEEHKEFLYSNDIIESGFEDFKALLEKEIKILQQKLQQASAPLSDEESAKILVVVRSADPDNLWKKTFNWLLAQKIVFHQLANDENILEKFALEPWHGFLFLCDSSARGESVCSPRKDMEQCRQIQLRLKNDEERPSVGIVYWPPPPDDPWPDLLKTTTKKMHLLLGDEPDTWQSFIADVRKVKL